MPYEAHVQLNMSRLQNPHANHTCSFRNFEIVKFFLSSAASLCKKTITRNPHIWFTLYTCWIERILQITRIRSLKSINPEFSSWNGTHFDKRKSFSGSLWECILMDIVLSYKGLYSLISRFQVISRPKSMNMKRNIAIFSRNFRCDRKIVSSTAAENL